MRSNPKKEYVGKIKLYADQNIRYGLVLALRSQGINIKHASEVGLLDRDDHRHFQYAQRIDRWLLTTDGHFLDNRKFPFEQMKGVVVVPDTGQDNVAGRVMAWLKYELVPSGKGIDHCKIELKSDKAIFHFRKEGRVYSQKIDFS